MAPKRKQDGKTPVSPQRPVVGCRLPPRKVCDLRPGSPLAPGEGQLQAAPGQMGEICQPRRGLDTPHVGCMASAEPSSSISSEVSATGLLSFPPYRLPPSGLSPPPPHPPPIEGHQQSPGSSGGHEENPRLVLDDPLPSTPR